MSLGGFWVGFGVFWGLYSLQLALGAGTPPSPRRLGPVGPREFEGPRGVTDDAAPAGGKAGGSGPPNSPREAQSPCQDPPQKTAGHPKPPNYPSKSPKTTPGTLQPPIRTLQGPPKTSPGTPTPPPPKPLQGPPSLLPVGNALSHQLINLGPVFPADDDIKGLVVCGEGKFGCSGCAPKTSPGPPKLSLEWSQLPKSAPNEPQAPQNQPPHPKNKPQVPKRYLHAPEIPSRSSNSAPTAPNLPPKSSNQALSAPRGAQTKLGSPPIPSSAPQTRRERL